MLKECYYCDQNGWTPEDYHIQKIVDTFAGSEEVQHFSHLTACDEIDKIIAEIEGVDI